MKYTYPDPSTMPAEIVMLKYITIGISQYEKLLEKYPEWFPDVLDWREKMSKVPQKVHDAYNQECTEFSTANFSNGPYGGMGILWYLDHPKEFAERQEWLKQNPNHLNTDHIFNKHYKPYGLYKPWETE